MQNIVESTEISASEWMSLNQFLHDLSQINSSCISVYYPYGKGKETISILQETQRNDYFEKIESRIEKRIVSLKKNPPSAGKFAKTLCIFGWVKDGKICIREIGTSKKTSVY